LSSTAVEISDLNVLLCAGLVCKPLLNLERASVFMPRRMSVTPPAIHTRTPAGKAIIDRRSPEAACQRLWVHVDRHNEAASVPQNDLDPFLQYPSPGSLGS
jgi:hypothetical protein